MTQNKRRMALVGLDHCEMSSFATWLNGNETWPFKMVAFPQPIPAVDFDPETAKDLGL